MKNTIKILSLCIILSIAACSKPAAIVNESDYTNYLNYSSDAQMMKMATEQDFWMNKLEKSPQQSAYLTKLSQVHSQRFSTSADINDLKKAEEYLLRANADYQGMNASVHRSIAHNYISQHRFIEAYSHLLTADSIGQAKMATTKMLFDVQMELGLAEEALSSLEKIRNDKDFDYLIRLAKWQDSEGRLENAITSLEKASAIAEDWNDRDLILWSYSNLADFYGHAGRIEDSYQYYLKSLAIDSNYAYALKGIAWIAYSHDKNTELAKQILDNLSKRSQSPDYTLFLAEIAHYEGESNLSTKYYNLFLKEASKSAYGDMYNVYLIEVQLKMGNNEKALELAKTEVKNRPTAMSWSYLASVYNEMGQSKEALEIVENKVLGQTEEPKAILIAAKILHNNEEYDQSEKLKKILFSALYELGPNSHQEVARL